MNDQWRIIIKFQVLSILRVIFSNFKFLVVHNYRPQGKVMFFTPVCLFTGWGEADPDRDSLDRDSHYWHLVMATAAVCLFTGWGEADPDRDSLDRDSHYWHLVVATAAVCLFTGWGEADPDRDPLDRDSHYWHLVMATAAVTSKSWPVCTMNYRSGTVNSNTVNSKFHLIRSFFEIFATFLLFHV